MFLLCLIIIDYVQSWTPSQKIVPTFSKSYRGQALPFSTKKGGRSPVALCYTGRDSLPSSKSKSTRKNDEEDTDDEPDSAFSAFYRRDPQDVIANSSFLQNLSSSRKTKLQHCFQQLHNARKFRDYQSSDAISAKLKREFGVRVFHNPPVWTTQKGAAPLSYLKKKQSNDLNRLRKIHGPRGHPYTQVGEGVLNESICPLSMKDIHDLLEQLTLARMEGNDGPLAAEAEAIQFELLINGVQVSDESKQWRADGIVDQWDDSVVSSVVSDGMDKQGVQILLYTEQPPTKTTSAPEPSRFAEHRPRVKQLIQLRAESIVREETDLVKSLTIELWKTYDVVIDDTRRTWSFQSENCERGEPNTSDNNSMVVETTESQEAILMPPVLFANGSNSWQGDSSFRASDHSREVTDSSVLDRIQYLVAERAQKREEGKFLEADSIRKELWMAYYVGLNDRLRQWSVGGVFDDR